MRYTLFSQDPLKRGRLRTNVPAISDHDLSWAEPCTPYAGPKLGWYVIPPAGANVWIEFERGDIDYPIWTGCFWGLDEKDGVPLDAQEPEIKVLQTEKMKLVLDDKAAIDLKNGASSVNLSPATVSINNGALEVM